MTKEIKNGQYLYLLGHQAHLGNLEFTNLTGIEPAGMTHEWLIADNFVDVSKTGSLVFQAKVISILGNKSEFLESIKSYLVSLEKTPKQLGLAGIVDSFWLSKIKNLGVKKINFITQIPSYGHWKQTKNWLLCLQIGDQFVLAKIENFVDQQFWRYLDESLPHGEMSRGLMNLKLARTLLNFTSCQNIFDPFAGYGRTAVAGIDLKSNFFLSDVDGEELEKEVQANLAQADKAWGSYIKLHGELTLARHSSMKTLDAQDLYKSQNLWPDFDPRSTAIVTEGFLGTNFTSQPNLNHIQTELVDLYRVWRNVIVQAGQMGFPEIIFCLPAYIFEKKQIYADWLEKAVAGTNYRLVWPNPVVYRRPKTFVGHHIVKLVLVK